MGGMISKLETLTDAQAAAWELTVNRVFAVLMCVALMVLLLAWLRTVHEERIEYARAYSNSKVKRAVENTERELDSWRTLDMDQKVRVAVLEDKIARLEKENREMRELMKRVRAGDVCGRAKAKV